MRVSTLVRSKGTKYFLVKVTTTYDGYEWGQKGLIQATSKKEAQKIADHVDFTHRGTDEEQEVGRVEEISKSDYDVLNKHGIFDIGDYPTISESVSE